MKRLLNIIIPSALGLLLIAELSFAQGKLPDVAPLGAAPRPGANQEQPPANMPETHAAPGGTDSTIVEGDEPRVPESPTNYDAATAEIIGSDANPEARGKSDDEVPRRYYGLYYDEKGLDYSYKVAFPVWAERKQPSVADTKIIDRASVYGGLYYNRRAADHADDILFPVLYTLRSPLEKSRATIIGPFVNRRTPTERDDWLLPFYAAGEREAGGHYELIPPLLTYRNTSGKDGFNLMGPAFCSWKGGSTCDARTAYDISWGVAPFYFFSQNEKHVREVIPPLFHYYRYNARSLEWTNIYGPYYRRHTPKRDMLHLLPFYWSIRGENERHTSVLPFFHYGYSGNDNLLVTPLFVNKQSEKTGNTFATLLYARHRGPTELDMITPLYWGKRDPRIGQKSHLFLPFLYLNRSPRETTTTVFPFFSWHERYGLRTSLWITPFVHTGKHLRGWSTTVAPLVHFSRDGHAAANVVAPFYFDFKSLKDRVTIAPPGLFVRVKNENTVHQIVGNVYYKKRTYSKGSDWQIHILPLFSYGESPDGHFWNILFGLAGYERDGTATTVKAAWIPIPISQ